MTPVGVSPGSQVNPGSTCVNQSSEVAERSASSLSWNRAVSGQRRTRVFLNPTVWVSEFPSVSTTLSSVSLDQIFSGAGAGGKDVENELRTVDDALFEPLLQGADLHAAQFAVKDHRVGLRFGGGRFDLINLALAHIARPEGAVHALAGPAGDFASGGLNEALHLCFNKGVFGIVLVDADDKELLFFVGCNLMQ